FDAWGRRRNVDDWTYTNTEPFVENGYNFSWLTRGYTGHEHLPSLSTGVGSLINMNGRIYDPVLGRMLSPDNYVQDATSTQGFNRYSYVVNNPLKYTDPSGEFLSGIGAAVLGWVNTIGDATSNAVSSGVLVQGAMAAGQVFAMAGITYVSLYTGAAISTYSIPFANTFAIMASSFTSNIGMSTLNGNTSVVVSVGFASYDFDNGKANGIWNWNNLEPIEKIGYSLGALANLSDIANVVDKFTHWEEKLRMQYFNEAMNNTGELDPNTLNKGYAKSNYVGGENVQTIPDVDGKIFPFYGTENPTLSDLSAQPHDIRWDSFKMKAGFKDFVFSQKSIGADLQLSGRAIYIGLKNLTINPMQAVGSLGLGIGSGIAFLPKTILYPFVGWW
ncbi:MAG: hypothetical protein IT232_10295, partial [Flavobacteriales bacterium]|nr:hypothetical protein [Flavobacteriales bacterium]